jgi:hypothetical protein
MSPRAPQGRSSSRRRGNSEGSSPRRRPDGRWQINLRVTDEFGESSRHTVYGATPQEARDKASGIRRRVEGGQPARDRRETVAAFTQHWIDTSLQASERKRNTKVMYGGVARTHILNSSIGQPLGILQEPGVAARDGEVGTTRSELGHGASSGSTSVSGVRRPHVASSGFPRASLLMGRRVLSRVRSGFSCGCGHGPAWLLTAAALAVGPLGHHHRARETQMTVPCWL